MGKLKTFFRNIKRLVSWIPVIWRTREFDYGYLFIIMEKQLKGMEEYMLQKGHHVNSEKTAHSIKIARVLLHRLITGHHLQNALIPVEREYGNPRPLLPFFREAMQHDKLTKSERIQFEKLWDKACKHSDYTERRDVNYLFDHIKKHHRSWWD